MERLNTSLRLHGMKFAFAALAAASQLALSSTQFPTIPPYLPVSKGDAVIMLTGSTNTTGYRIVVSPSGSAEYVSAAGQANGTISSELATRLFSDLAATAPLNTIAEGSCAKPASFATSLYMYWNHQRSPDLSCLEGGRGKSLIYDTNAVASELGLGMRLRRVMRPLLPGEVHKPLPTPT
jgi:hypothetical protein